MADYPIVDLMSTTMSRIREFADVDTIIGKPVTTDDGITIIPVSKVSIGFGSGGGDSRGTKPPGNDTFFAGGGAAGVNITPVAFLIVQKGEVKVLSVNSPAATTIDRVVDMVPGVVDKIGSYFKKDKEDGGKEKE